MVATANWFKDVLTGRCRARVTWTGRIVMQVEVTREYRHPTQSATDTPSSVSVLWRDARKEDVLRPVIFNGTEDK